MRSSIQRLLSSLILCITVALLAGCLFHTTSQRGLPGSATSAVPTPIASGSQPTTGAPVATVVPTAVANSGQNSGAGSNQPVPSKPTIDFQPRGGVAGTSVTMRGWGFSSNGRVAVRIGLPAAVGEVLASAQPDARGAWTTQVIIPGTLPSGEKITTPTMRLVAMNDQNQPLASAAFAFQPGNPPVDDNTPTDRAPVYGFANSSEEAVRYLLDSLHNYPNGPQAFDYVSKDLSARYQGKGAYNMLQLQNPFQNYTLDGVIGMDGQWVVQQVTFDGITRFHFVTTMVDAQGPPWVVSEVRPQPLDDHAPGTHSAEQIAAAEQIVRAYFEATGADRAGEAWALETPELQVTISQDSLATSGPYVVSSLVDTAGVAAQTGDSITFRATVNMILEPTAPTSLGGGLRDFEVTVKALPAQGWCISNFLPL